MFSWPQRWPKGVVMTNGWNALTVSHSAWHFPCQRASWSETRASHLTTLLASGTQRLHIIKRYQHLLNLLVCACRLRTFRKLGSRTLARHSIKVSAEAPEW